MTQKHATANGRHDTPVKANGLKQSLPTMRGGLSLAERDPTLR